MNPVDARPPTSAGPVACADCGVSTHNAVTHNSQATTIRTSPGGVRITVPVCSDCQHRAGTAAGRARDLVSTRRPGWLRTMPWRSAERALARDTSLLIPSYIPDAIEDPPPQRDRWGHVPDELLARLRAAAEAEAWPSQPPQVPDAYTRPAIDDWPTETCCWRCGDAVDTGGTVVEAPSPTDQWITQDRSAAGIDRRDESDRQAREQVRSDAPRVPGAAWRECGTCASAGPEQQAQRILPTDSTVNTARAARLGALASMPWPVYAASETCTGQTDPGADAPYAWYDTGWWASELARQIELHTPPAPVAHRYGIGCQVCGVAASIEWAVLGALPCCRDCARMFAPAPPVEHDAHGRPVSPDPAATREHDRRPLHHPRGRWWSMSWDTAPAPDGDTWGAMSPTDRDRWDAAHTVRDADLIAAYAANRPDLVHPGLAGQIGMYLAYEHPAYRQHGGWSESWAYLGDHPTNTTDSPAEAVRELLSPRSGSAVPVTPVPHRTDRPTVVSPHDIRNAREQAERAARARAADAALMTGGGGR